MTPVGRYRALDGWRGVCALLVATYHYPRSFSVLDWPIFSAGWVFVDFFFVLSGFVITHRYLEAGVSLDIRSFVAARLRRLYPTHAITACAMIGVTLFVSALRFATSREVRFDGFGDTLPDFLAMLASHALLLQGFLPFAHVGLDVPSWSISVEFWTNLLFAAAAVLGLVNLAVLALVAAASTALLALSDPLRYIDGDAVMNMTRAIQGFALGAIAYRLLRRAPRLRGLGAPALTLAEAACLGLLILATALGARLAFVWTLPLMFAIAVFVFAMGGGALSRVLLTRPFQRAGADSYSIYLVHMIWVSLFYVAQTILARLPLPIALSNAAPAAPAFYLLYLALVWFSAALLQDFVAKRFAAAPRRRLDAAESPA